MENPKPAAAQTNARPATEPDAVRPTTHAPHEPVKETPLPWGQLLILCIVLLTESICSTVLIPFTPSFVAHLQHWEVASAGYAAGFPVGLFMLGQVLSGKMWSSVSDKVGRVIGINCGVTGCAICMFLFGLSGSIWTMCLWRFMHGLVAGCSIIAKTMISDLTDTTNRAKGLALVSLTWGVGTLFGPYVGGTFYDPANTMGFSKTGFFASHPAFLPSLIVACYNVFAVVVSSLFLHESHRAARPLCEVLPPKFVAIFGPVIRIIQPKLPCDEKVAVTITAADGGKGAESGQLQRPNTVAVSAEPCTPQQREPHHSFGFKQALQNPLLRRVLVISMLISCSDMAFSQIFPLWCASSPAMGGLGLKPALLANLVVVNSVPAVCANIVFAKTIQVVGGPIRLWTVSQVLYGLLTCVMPIATSMTPSGGFYYTMAVGMLRKIVECWSFGLIMLVVSMTAPPGKVGIMFGIQQSTACMVRCGVPFVFSPLFAWSIGNNHPFPFNHYFTFLLCLIPLLVSAYMTWYVYFPSEDAHEEEGDDAEDGNAGGADETGSRRRSCLGSGRGSLRSRCSFFSTVPREAAERESLLLHNSFANLAHSFATNIIPGMPQNTILAVPVGAPLQVPGECTDTAGRRGGEADSRDASSQEGDEADNDAEYSSVADEMAEVAAATAGGSGGREEEGRRLGQRRNKSEDEELPL